MVVDSCGQSLAYSHRLRSSFHCSSLIVELLFLRFYILTTTSIRILSSFSSVTPASAQFCKAFCLYIDTRTPANNGTYGSVYSHARSAGNRRCSLEGVHCSVHFLSVRWSMLSFGVHCSLFFGISCSVLSSGVHRSAVGGVRSLVIDLSSLLPCSVDIVQRSVDALMCSDFLSMFSAQALP